MITIEPNRPPIAPRVLPDEESHPTLDDDILNEDVESATERSAEDFKKDEEKDTPPPPADEARA